jgi:mono/diheme cytochrome c family protein
MKNLRRAIFIFLAAAILAAGCASARRDEPFTPPLNPVDPRVALGQRVFAAHCDECHVGGAGGYGPSLNDKLLPAWYIRMRVRAGLGAMPPFDKDQITDDQLDAVAFYIQALRGLPG